MSPAETEAVIRQAMQLFWQKGTDVPFSHIVEATGQSRKTLYAVFGDKATLVGAALGMYRQEVLTPMMALLDPPNGTAVYWDTYERAAQLPGWLGCLLVRTATGEGKDQELVQDAFRSYSNQFVAAMKAAYIREGEVGDPEKSAWAAFGLMVSISALAGSGGLDDRVSALFSAARAANGLLPSGSGDIEDDMAAS